MDTNKSFFTPTIGDIFIVTHDKLPLPRAYALLNRHITDADTDREFKMFCKSTNQFTDVELNWFNTELCGRSITLLSSNQMRDYSFSFTGRESNAIGIFYRISTTINAPDIYTACEILCKRYEHISELKVNDKNLSVTFNRNICTAVTISGKIQHNPFINELVKTDVF